MALSKGKYVPTPVTYLAQAVYSVARRVLLVHLEPAVHQATWHAQETVRIAFSFLRLSLRSRTSRSSGCLDSLGDCCPNAGCCTAGRVSVCNCVNDEAISDSVFHRPASLRLMERLVAALAVQPVLPSVVSRPSKHNPGLPLKP